MTTTLKILTYVAKVAGLVASLNAIPFISPSTGVIVFFIASVLKDTINRIGDFLDDGKENSSFTY
ncbi:MAG: hypothetical protein B9S32_17330 [Verrucomicrobia bacterium Tous-C9LFEB]|nr:MAG: hypothetical protein B9S32_17330 [Verrucomicrobia bacterium Tous-C9LFEB]